jgi:pSer/pThr/pTyr-binding forkhead associated (FHA) protein
MDSERSYILFSPPHLPHRLSDTEAAAIGRHSSCEFVLRKDDVSRRHAEVFYEGGQFRIRDLGSTNGSFVNGERADASLPLGPGDKIEIGSSIIVFCQVDGDVGILDEEHNAAQTMIAMRPPVASAEAFQGELSEIPPDALLQLLEMGRKTGMLELTSHDGVGRLWMERGYPVHAESEKSIGFDAAMMMVTNDSGRFRFEPQVGTEDRTITASVTELLLEASRVQDEMNRGRGEDR